MSDAILESMLQSPMLPELIEQAQRAFAREQKLRRKFYADITPEHKWEFIQGEVIMHSPEQNRHLAASQRIYGVLSGFTRVQRLGLVRHEKAMTCFPRNDYEPDVIFFGPAKAAMIDPDTLKFPHSRSHRRGAVTLDREAGPGRRVSGLCPAWRGGVLDHRSRGGDGGVVSSVRRRISARGSSGGWTAVQ